MSYFNPALLRKTASAVRSFLFFNPALLHKTASMTHYFNPGLLKTAEFTEDLKPNQLRDQDPDFYNWMMHYEPKAIDSRSGWFFDDKIPAKELNAYRDFYNKWQVDQQNKKLNKYRASKGQAESDYLPGQGPGKNDSISMRAYRAGAKAEDMTNGTHEYDDFAYNNPEMENVNADYEGYDQYGAYHEDQDLWRQTLNMRRTAAGHKKAEELKKQLADPNFTDPRQREFAERQLRTLGAEQNEDGSWGEAEKPTYDAMDDEIYEMKAKSLNDPNVSEKTKEIYRKEMAEYEYFHGIKDPEKYRTPEAIQQRQNQRTAQEQEAAFEKERAQGGFYDTNEDVVKYAQKSKERYSSDPEFRAWVDENILKPQRETGEDYVASTADQLDNHGWAEAANMYADRDIAINADDPEFLEWKKNDPSGNRDFGKFNKAGQRRIYNKYLRDSRYRNDPDFNSWVAHKYGGKDASTLSSYDLKQAMEQYDTYRLANGFDRPQVSVQQQQQTNVAQPAAVQQPQQQTQAQSQQTQAQPQQASNYNYRTSDIRDYYSVSGEFRNFVNTNIGGDTKAWSEDQWQNAANQYAASNMDSFQRNMWKASIRPYQPQQPQQQPQQQAQQRVQPQQTQQRAQQPQPQQVQPQQRVAQRQPVRKQPVRQQPTARPAARTQPSLPPNMTQGSGVKPVATVTLSKHSSVGERLGLR